ncbi:MAG: hypothetical protein RIE24_09045 [Silicimonas sp.]
MRKAAARRFEFDLSTRSVTRLLIVSYFIGLGFGYVDGTRIDVLLSPFLPDSASKLVASATVIGLAVLILLPKYRRGAALLLALFVFWASYLTMVVQSDHGQIGSFWRDLALIGALLLTYGDARDSIRIKPFGLVSWRPSGSKSASSMANPGVKAPETAQSSGSVASTKPETRHPKRVKTELYRQDFDVIRVP